MSNQHVARWLGIALLAVGLMGFIPAFVRRAPEATPLVLTTPGFGFLLGLFPINLWHNLVHVAFGVWGITASRSISETRRYGMSVAVIYAIMATMGVIPYLNTLFGLVPLFGHDVWLHAGIALIAAYAAFANRGAAMGVEEQLRRRAG